MKGSSLLHAAVALNSVTMTEFLLKQNKAWAEKDISENTVFLQSIKAKNQASLVIIRHKLFVQQFEETEMSFKILTSAFENENIDVLLMIVNLLD